MPLKLWGGVNLYTEVSEIVRTIAATITCKVVFVAAGLGQPGQLKSERRARVVTERLSVCREKTESQTLHQVHSAWARGSSMPEVSFIS